MAAGSFPRRIHHKFSDHGGGSGGGGGAVVNAMEGGFGGNGGANAADASLPMVAVCVHCNCCFRVNAAFAGSAKFHANTSSAARAAITAAGVARVGWWLVVMSSVVW